MIRLASPELLLFLLVPALVLSHWLWRRDRQAAALSFSRVQAFDRPGPWSGRTWLKVLRLCAMVLLAVAAARPQGARRWTEQVAEGIDIFLVLDISSSMSADDFFPNRLSVAKSVVQRFTEGRSQDRMGLIAFAAQSYPKCPLTLDHELLRAQLREIYLAKGSEDGTAIGMALAGALARLRHSRSKNKVVILLTDGVNNRGSVAPLTGAAMARALGIKVYTVGVGSERVAQYRVEEDSGQVRTVAALVKIDEANLRSIARVSGGSYFRATDAASLEAIYEEIDGLERSRFRVRRRLEWVELYPYFLWLALGLVLLEAVLDQTVLKKLP